jgi:uncharacterized protein YbjT (DUF2867 family)
MASQPARPVALRSAGASPTILVTGPTGTVGSRLVRHLAAAGVKPRALVRSREKADAIASFATPIIGDLLVPDSLEPAFRGAERVFVLGQPTPQIETLERSAIDAAIAAGARRIVYLSNFTAEEGSEERPMHVHGLHERLLRSLGIDWTVLRPTRFMTNVPFMWPSVLSQGLLLEAGGPGIMSFIDPDDVAAVAMKALIEDGHAGQTYKLTSEDAYTAADLAGLLSRVVGREVRIFEGNLDALRDALIANSAPREYAPLMANYFGKVAAGLFEPTDTLGKVLGRAPRAYADWLQDNLPAALRAAAQ